VIAEALAALMASRAVEDSDLEVAVTKTRRLNRFAVCVELSWTAQT
jgi:hypothetical protein